MDKSFLEDFSLARAQRRKRLKLILAISPILLTALVFGSYKGINALTHRNDGTPKIATAGPIQVEGVSTTEPVPTPATATTPALTPPAIKSPNAGIDVDALDAKICGDSIKAAQNLAAGWSKLYFDAWKSWNEGYVGQYDSPEALQSKQFIKDHTKKLFDDLISSDDPSLKKVCHSSTSLREILVMPNYDAWL